jgi:serine/threonine protein kinase
MSRLQYNIMITCGGRAMLADVGMTNFTTTEPTGNAQVPLTWPYQSPEEIQNAGGNHATPGDVYSFATVSCTVRSLPLGFVNMLNRSNVRQIYSPMCIKQQDFVKVCQDGHQHLQKPADMPHALWELLRRCMRLDPAERPNMTAVVATLNGF